MSIDANIENLLAMSCLPWEDLSFGTAGNNTFQLSLQELHHFGLRADTTELTRILNRLAAGVRATDVFLASIFANECGILVECGADPDVAISRVLDTLDSQFQECRTLLERCDEKDWPYISGLTELMLTREPGKNDASYLLWEKLERPGPGRGNLSTDIKAWLGLRFTVSAAMAMLCRSMEARISARTRHFLLARAKNLAPFSMYAWYIARLLGEEDDALLTVVYPTKERAFRIRAEGISHNNQLFELLQLELCQRLGESLIQRDDGGINAIWTFYQWTGLRPDGTFSPWLELQHRIIGEQRLTNISILAGEQIIVLAPRQLVSGGWVGFDFTPIHPEHKQAVSVLEELPGEEVQELLQRIRTATRS